MSLLQRWKEVWNGRPEDLEPARKLALDTGFNVRELGGYAVDGGVTSYRRFLRSGGLDMLSLADQQRLHNYGVRLVVDLRGMHEVELARDRLTQMSEVRYLHAPLYDINLSDPALEPKQADGDFWALGYLTMLANRTEIARIFSFFASAKQEDTILYHCAAGMDRTGVISMLLLGLAGASRRRIVADYCYSFASEQEVDDIVYRQRSVKRRELELRLEAVNTVLDRVAHAYGTFDSYLDVCGVRPEDRRRVKEHLMA